MVFDDQKYNFDAIERAKIDCHDEEHNVNNLSRVRLDLCSMMDSGVS
jgi:hypothetical protein